MALSPQLITQWKAEEACAHIRGWDFSHLEDRFWEDTDFGWDYRQEVLEHLDQDMRVLDLDTGGGEFLLSLNHPHHLLAATENYPPNAALCMETLLPLGVDFHQAPAKGPLPFADESFDLVINRHGDFDADEIFRVLKKGGRFITQQVGAQNDRELVELLLGDTPLPFPGQTLAQVQKQFEDTGFTIKKAMEAFRPMAFYDVGALVWFARIIEWEFPHFSVDQCLPALENAQRLMEQDGKIVTRTHRFLLIALKP
ncbi:MAG: class I SAM-dependent methyltransferase [Clostridia bacterium]|nr:class I SAM-dependent methyltransferase [Clostridia bacterium]